MTSRTLGTKTVFGITAALLLSPTACGKPTATPPAAPTPSPAAVATAPGTAAAGTEGAVLYLQYCAVCHGPDGGAAAGVVNAPLLNSQGLLAVADDAFLAAAIREGRPGEAARGRPGTKMPAFGSERGRILTEAQIEAIVRHIRAWQTEPSVPLAPYAAEGSPAAGAATYARDCGVCHGPDGWGTEAPRLAGPVFQQTASDAFIRHTIRHGRPGTRMQGLAYDDRTMDDLVAFIRTLGDGSGP